MSYQTYLLIHLVAVFAILGTMIAMALHMVGGGTKASFGARKLAAAVHGTGLIVALIAGFGLLARLGLAQGGIPGWAIAKLVIWLILGAMPVLIYRVPKAATLLFVLIFVFGGLATYLAIFKPGSLAGSSESGSPTAAIAEPAKASAGEPGTAEPTPPPSAP